MQEDERGGGSGAGGSALGEVEGTTLPFPPSSWAWSWSPLEGVAVSRATPERLCLANWCDHLLKLLVRPDR